MLKQRSTEENMREPTLFYPRGQATHSSITALPHGRNVGRKALMLAIDPGASQCIGEVLDRCGFEPVLLSKVAELRSCIRKGGISVLVCEDVLLDGNYKEVLHVSRSVGGHTPVVVFSRLADWDQYLEAIRLGAFDCLRYPFRTGELRWVVNRALQELSLGCAGEKERSSSP
jgi:DNA-binding NtrC family response regulator